MLLILLETRNFFCDILTYLVTLAQPLSKRAVVSTVVSGIHFARFPTVECINSKDCSFLL